MRNIEIKAKIKQVAALIEKAKSLSSSEGQVIKQHDFFYGVNKGRLKLRKFEDGADANLIYYERPDQAGPKLSTFDLTKISAGNVEGLHKVLERSLGVIGTVQKVRHLFMVGQTRVHIDSVAGLGDFMELEVVLSPEQSVQEGKQIAQNLMKSLGIDENDLITGAYIDLLK